MNAAQHRVGQPSPLIFHLSAALSSYSQALLAAPRSNSPNFPWTGGLAEEAAKLGPDLDQIEIAREIAARLLATVEGLEVWQQHPYRRKVNEPATIWSRGCTRLVDYGTAPESTEPFGDPVLVVPSLINKAYILDLEPGRSLLRWMASIGLRPILLDWGVPGAREADFGLNDYGQDRFLPAIKHLSEITQKTPAVMGYCMGGTLAAAMAARAPDSLSRLVTIGAPWDFASTTGISGSFRAMLRTSGTTQIEEMIDGLGQAFGLVPVSLFQMLFAMVNPMQASVKFRRLARMDPNCANAELFVALEDWLADGVPMPAPAARDLLVGWQIKNDTALGRWRFLDDGVDLAAVRVPTLSFCGMKDSIAPPVLSEPLAAAIPDARTLRPQTGHVGMVVGSAARASVWRPLAEFLRAQTG